MVVVRVVVMWGNSSERERLIAGDWSAFSPLLLLLLLLLLLRLPLVVVVKACVGYVC